MFNLKPLWDNLSTQAIILLSIVALALIVAGVMTQGFGRTIATVAGVFVLIAVILILGNAKEVGQWVKDNIFTGVGGANTILPWKGAIEPWNITTRESLSNLTRFIR